MNILPPKRFYFIVLIIILAFWMITLFVPTGNCHQEYFLAIHWEVCDNLSSSANVLYEIFQIITILGTAYLIVGAVLYLQSNPK